MPDHTAKTVTDISLSSIIYKNDKLNKAKHYIITYIEHVKIPKLKSLPMKDLWREKMEKIIWPQQSTQNETDRSEYIETISNRERYWVLGVKHFVQLHYSFAVTVTKLHYLCKLVTPPQSKSIWEISCIMFLFRCII